MSHSHVDEWISGSFIQSHWPCMTLWPISMFSRILATPSMAAPATHAGFQRDAKSVTRPATARLRWMVMIRLMYAASAAPRDSSTSARRASSSRPSWSTSSSVRWVYSWTSLMAMVGSFRWWGSSVGGPQMSRVQSPTGTVTQVCTRSLVSSCSSPVRRSRTVPLTSVSVQVWQMPIRQP